jgi:hypothetical protein
MGTFSTQRQISCDFVKMLKYDMEKCQQKFLKFAMGVNRKAPIIGLYGESGRYPLVIEMLCNGIKNLQRIVAMPENSLLYQGYIENLNIKHQDSWIMNSKVVGKIVNGTSFPNINVSYLKNILIDKFSGYWHNCLFNDSRTEHGNKLRNYRQYKYNFRKEEYLSILTYRPYRSSLAKLRLSAHKLHIETGRYCKRENKLHPSERLCNVCNLKQCENEYHL